MLSVNTRLTAFNAGAQTTVVPAFASNTFGYHVNLPSNLFTFSLSFDPRVTCTVTFGGTSNPCADTQNVQLSSVSGTVTITLNVDSDQPLLTTTYTFLVSQPICNLQSFSVASTFTDPISCTPGPPLDVHSLGTNCVANSTQYLVDLSIASTDSCYNPTYQFFNDTTEAWEDCDGASCPLFASRNNYQVTFDNANNPSYLNISNGLSCTVYNRELMPF